ncbi:MAG: pyruvate kinase [Acidimicrobiia bacterium]|nr:pyruvate kinase [Acidimicrobiia bacterium]
MPRPHADWVRRTRIIATVGPACATPAQIAALVAAGANVIRLNASHASTQEMQRAVETIRALPAGRQVAVLVDLAGPKLRLSHPVAGEVGDVVPLDLPDTVRPGDRVLLADGVMALEVVDGGLCRVLVAGDLPAGKGINLPSSRLDMPALTPKDAADLDFAVSAEVDYVALSFVRCAADLDTPRASGIPVVAKIETAEAVQNLEGIVAAADGVMVARGDLGVEIPIERVPVVQKEVAYLANEAAKPVIVATQMLGSMVANPTPTRAEASDVANAVLDGADALMLSEETAVGGHPAAAVSAMARIAAEAETIEAPRMRRLTDTILGDEPAYITRLACRVAEQIGAAAIIVPTKTGFTARQVARWRPRTPIIALASDPSVRRRLSLTWGVTALSAPWYGTGAEAVFWNFTEPVRRAALVGPGAKVVLTAGWPMGEGGITNTVHVATI